MKTIQLRMIFRGWARNKVYTVISILSLIVGLTCCMLMGGFVMNEFRIAEAVPDSEQWYSLKGKNVFYNDTEVESLTVGNGDYAVRLHDRFPEVTDYCVFHGTYAELVDGKKTSYINGYYEVMPEFVHIFHPEVLEGDLKQTLSRPGEVAVTRSFALHTFGTEQVVGQPLTMAVSRTIRTEEGCHNELRSSTYTVTSVIDDSRRSFLNYNVLTGLPASEIATDLKGWIGFYYTFIRLDQGVKPVDFEKKIAADSTLSPVKLVAMNDIYFMSGGDSEGLTLNRDPLLLYVGISIALAVLIIACFNYINICMTRTLQRLKNTGQQMVFGASEWQMKLQLMAETGVQVLVAFGVALLLIHQFLPQFNALFSSRLKLSDFFTGLTPGVLALLLLTVTVLPSLYIFTHLGKVQLSRILKQEYSRRSRLITGMVIAQFAASIVLLIFVLNIHRQMDFIAHSRPEAESIIFLDPDYRMEEGMGGLFYEKLASIPEVEAVTRGSGMTESMLSVDGRNMNIVEAASDYFDFYHLEFVAGSPFNVSSPKDRVVVNETMVKRWEIKEPIGYSFEFNGRMNTICGVVKDYVMDDFTRAVEPLMIVADGGYMTVVKVAPENRKAAIAKMAALWKEIAPDQGMFEWRTMADSYVGLHQDQAKMMKLVLIFSWLSLILTCMGLFGLAWYSVENRHKEIALRKVSGATERQIVALLCGHFLKWILIAFVIAAPFAFYFSQEWLAQFVYRQEVAAWTYFTIGLFVLCVGGVTVIWQSWRAAGKNPVETLKSE